MKKSTTIICNVCEGPCPKHNLGTKEFKKMIPKHKMMSMHGPCSTFKEPTKLKATLMERLVRQDPTTANNLLSIAKLKLVNSHLRPYFDLACC